MEKQKGRVLPRPLRHILQKRTKFFSAAPPRTTVNTSLRYPIGCPLSVTSTGDTGGPRQMTRRSAGVPLASSSTVPVLDCEQTAFSVERSGGGTPPKLAGGTPNATRISRHVVGVFCGPGHVIRPA